MSHELPTAIRPHTMRNDTIVDQDGEGCARAEVEEHGTCEGTPFRDELVRRYNAFPDLLAALVAMVEGAPTAEDLADVPVREGQQIKLNLWIDSAKVRAAQAAIAKAEGRPA